ncbi:glycosyltransferase family 25 protein [Ursidibacter sp. B-7004-1]
MQNINSTPIFVINLAKSVERKNAIISQFEQLNKQLQYPIQYSFFSAIDGNDNPDFYLFKKYNKQKRFTRKGNYMSLSQLGCWASHYLLWEKCVELNQSVIVLEDDALLQDNFIDVYKFTSSEQNSVDFIWLSPPTFKTLDVAPVFNIENTETYLSKVTIPYDNATGYFITPKAAQALLNSSQEWIYEVDIVMDRFWEHKINLYGIFPACVRPNTTIKSNIQSLKGKQKRTLLEKLRREYYTIIDKVNKKKFLLCNR